MTLPLAPLAAALQLLISSAATSIKEAQTWLSMTLFIPMIPGLIMSIRPVNPEPWMAAVPVLGQQVLSGAALRGEPLPAVDLALSIGSLTVLTVLTMGMLIRVFGDERPAPEMSSPKPLAHFMCGAWALIDGLFTSSRTASRRSSASARAPAIRPGPRSLRRRGSGRSGCSQGGKGIHRA